MLSSLDVSSSEKPTGAVGAGGRRGRRKESNSALPRHNCQGLRGVCTRDSWDADGSGNGNGEVAQVPSCVFRGLSIGHAAQLDVTQRGSSDHPSLEPGTDPPGWWGWPLKTAGLAAPSLPCWSVGCVLRPSVSIAKLPLI